ncbi:hypothetical protein TNCV_217351 [Trichonephila clavipes]|nr:hypothetical protein TNCV_217351 [Trichonephila clavipes]
MSLRIGDLTLCEKAPVLLLKVTVVLYTSTAYEQRNIIHFYGPRGEIILKSSKKSSLRMGALTVTFPFSSTKDVPGKKAVHVRRRSQDRKSRATRKPRLQLTCKKKPKQQLKFNEEAKTAIRVNEEAIAAIYVQ